MLPGIRIKKYARQNSLILEECRKKETCTLLRFRSTDVIFEVIFSLGLLLKIKVKSTTFTKNCHPTGKNWLPGYHYVNMKGA